jgi:site-specific DNA recombinase
MTGPQEKIAARPRKIRDERARLARQVDGDQLPRLDTARDALSYLLDVFSDPQELYRPAITRARLVLNQAIFVKLYLDSDEDGPYVASDE